MRIKTTIATMLITLSLSAIATQATAAADTPGMSHDSICRTASCMTHN